MNVRQLSMATRNDLVRAVSERYASSSRAEKSAILNEFTAVTGFNRKHAVRLLRGVGDPLPVHALRCLARYRADGRLLEQPKAPAAGAGTLRAPGSRTRGRRTRARPCRAAATPRQAPDCWAPQPAGRRSRYCCTKSQPTSAI